MDPIGSVNGNQPFPLEHLTNTTLWLFVSGAAVAMMGGHWALFHLTTYLDMKESCGTRIQH